MYTFLAVALGAVIAAVSGLLTGWQNYRLASRRDQLTHAHEQQMTQEARHQDRLERAYTELGIYLSHYADWARSVRPMLGPVPAPDPMLPQERWQIETLVTNHGSPQVQQLLKRWVEIARKIDNADAVIRLAEQARGSDLDQEALRERKALEDYRKAMDEAADDIRAQMSAELDGRAVQVRA
jgi:hypothetical protein